MIDYRGAPNEIYRNLRDRILRGELRSGDRIKIRAVADEFGVSIIPVREAMRMLEADRLIELPPRRSPVVSGVSPEEAIEIGKIRLALEPVALEAAILNMDRASLAAARACIVGYDQSRDIWEQVELNRRFHLTLYRPCGMERLLTLISEQYDGMTRFAQYTVIQASKSVRERSLSEHRDILRACHNGDVATAKDMLRAHLEAAIGRLSDGVAAAPPGRLAS